MNLVLNPTLNLWYEASGQVYCDSSQIATEFEKEHLNILKIIEGENRKGAHVDGLIDGIIQSSGNPLDYFIKVKYRDARNRQQPKYLMTRDGFVLLVMGFTGARALRFKLDYIRRFNQMEAFIKSLRTAKVEFPALMDAVYSVHDEPKEYHYTNELNMLYRIVTGSDAKHYREAHDVPKGQSIRPYLPPEQIKSVENLQRIDIGLIFAGKSFAERKAILDDHHKHHHPAVVLSVVGSITDGR